MNYTCDADEGWIELSAAAANVLAWLKLRQNETGGLVTEPPVSSPDERGGALDRLKGTTGTSGQPDSAVPVVSTGEGLAVDSK